MFSDSECGIIIAADVDSLDALRQISEIAVGFPEVVAIKVGFSLALRFGLRSVVRAVKETAAIEVIYDHQKAATDIPQTASLFANACSEAGIEGVIFFPQAGPGTLEAYVTAAMQRKLTPIVGLVMTHGTYLQSEGGYIIDTAPDMIARDAIGLGVQHFVLPGTKPDIVSRFARGALAALTRPCILMPGIGAQGGALTVAFDAAQPHRPFAIIGSSIYAAKDAKQAVANFAKEVRLCQ